MITILPPVAILAGGLATRMHPLTETIPKSMLEVAGQPFIAHQLRLLKKQGVAEVVMCVGFLAHMIEAYVGNGERFGLHVTYSPDGDTLLGTGGALRKALPLLGDRFFVLYGDSYLPTDFAPVYEAFKKNLSAQALMTVFRNQGKWDTSNVAFSDGKIKKYDKKNLSYDMHYIDYGLGVLTAPAFAPWPQHSKFDLADLYQFQIKNDSLAGYEVAERFYEIGSRQGLRETSEYLAVAAL